MKNYFITTPIYYVNDKPHIGHLYTTLACDILARFYRAHGDNVFFLTGTDEHGQKVEKSAQAKNIAPQAFADEVAQHFKNLIKDFDFSADYFIRTTDEAHKKAAQAIWQKLEQNGDIYLSHYKGWYAVRDEAYYQEQELTKKEGKFYAPTGSEVEWVEEESYFFRLSRYQEPLLNYYETHPDFIMPEGRRNEVISFVKGGLKDLSISRTTFSWGVPVPNAPQHVMYVWLDALTNYISALGFPDEAAPQFQQFWPGYLHMVGKDILRFHAVYWPAFLLSAQLALPKHIVAHGWWTIEGEKMSKSLGNVINPYDIKATYGNDAIRYFLMRDVPFGQDGDFSHNALRNRYKSELMNDLGNLIQRVLSFVQKNVEGKIPEDAAPQPQDGAYLQEIYGLLALINDDLAHFSFHKALEHIWQGIRRGNQYIDEEAPWTLKKTDTLRMQSVLYTLLESFRYFGLILLPFIPETAHKILDFLRVAEKARTLHYWDKAYALQPGTLLPAPQVLFPRLEEDT